MIVVTAASGNLGKAIAQAFVNKGLAASVTLTARDPGKLADAAKAGFAIAKADYDDSSSMEQAFAGAKVLLMISGVGPSDARIIQHKAVIDAAKAAGVGRIVYISFANPTSDSLFEWAKPHVATESYLKDSGIPFTILRDNQYAANLAGPIGNAISSGVFAIPGAAGKVAYVTHQDVAASAVAAASEAGHEGKIYELTGPAALDAFDIARLLSEATGKEIKVVDAAPDDYCAFFRSLEMPEFVVEALISIYAASAAGEYATVSSDVQTLTGRPATTFGDFIKTLL